MVLLAALLFHLAACADPDVASVGPSGDSGAPADSGAPSAGDGPEQVPGANWTAPTYDPDGLPDGVRHLNLEIDPAAMARLDADPYHAPDEPGVLVDEDGVRHDVDLSYRGAYALLSVMTSYDLRNWKVKFPDDDPYRDRREWNFNYEPHVQQKLAYDLFRFAGVAVVDAEHVVLSVNGVYQGVYLQYNDPDDRRWRGDSFGDDDGDLYKAAYDLPGEAQCFADLTWLGDADADYACHYTLMTNNEVDPGDVAVLRGFIDDLNFLSDAAFAAWVDDNVDVAALISYLVVSNFINNWDSYPQRPKNYWLYEDRTSDRMAFIPWDLDGTFGPHADGTYNQTGASAPLLYNLVTSDYRPVHSSEGAERPLVRRLFAIPAVQQTYLERYAALSATILSAAYLEERVAALHAQIEAEADPTDLDRLQGNRTTIDSFISQRASFVEEAL